MIIGAPTSTKIASRRPKKRTVRAPAFRHWPSIPLRVTHDPRPHNSCQCYDCCALSMSDERERRPAMSAHGVSNPSLRCHPLRSKGHVFWQMTCISFHICTEKRYAADPKFFIFTLLNEFDRRKCASLRAFRGEMTPNGTSADVSVTHFVQIATACFTLFATCAAYCVVAIHILRGDFGFGQRQSQISRISRWRRAWSTLCFRHEAASGIHFVLVEHIPELPPIQCRKFR